MQHSWDSSGMGVDGAGSWEYFQEYSGNMCLYSVYMLLCHLVWLDQNTATFACSCIFWSVQVTCACIFRSIQVTCACTVCTCYCVTLCGWIKTPPRLHVVVFSGVFR